MNSFISANNFIKKSNHLPKWVNAIYLLKLLGFSILCSLLFASCLKSDSHNQSVQVAGIALINASPGSPNLDFVADGSKEPLYANFAYDSAIAYLPAYPGYRVFGFTLHNSYNLLISKQFYLEPGNAYSIFITDTLGAAQLIGFKDSLDSIDSSKSYIRFINLSADAPPLSLRAGETNLPQADSIAYSKATDFFVIASGNNYTFNLDETNSGKRRFSLSDIKIEKGKVYTIWARGISNQTSIANSTNVNQQLGISYMRNK